jgi:cell volume regulation protein A
MSGRIEPGLGLARLFLMQMGIGTLVGLGVGLMAVRIINRINLEAAGLYPVLASACGLLAFGIASSLGGSGFLSIYLAGIVLGNSRFVFDRGTFLFMDGLAWIGQITMFVVLGLLSTPSDLVGVTGPGLLVAAVLILVARPAATVPLLLPFRFGAREHLLVAWGGLKGAVPIILATFPLMFGIPEGRLIFDVVFFVVLVSAVVQGATLAPLATRLGLQQPPRPEAPASLELMALRDVNAEIVDYVLTDDGPIARKRVRDLKLPEGAVIAMVSRGRTLIPPRGSTLLQVGDHVFVITRQETRADVDRVFREQLTGVSAADSPDA